MLNRLLKKLAGSFEKKAIPYMVIGGQAVLVYGEPRLTKDIDITLGVGIERFKDIIKIAKELNLKILVKDELNFVKKNMVLPLKDTESPYRIDLIFSFTAFETIAIKRAVSISVGRKKVKFVTAEDLIIFKLFAGRARDIEDIRNILRKNKKIDKTYVEKWLRIFDKSNGKKLLIHFRKLISELNK